MGIHEARGPDSPPLAANDSQQSKRERLTIDIVDEDRPVVDAMAGQVIDPFGFEESLRSPHGGRVQVQVSHVCAGLRKSV
jgi:hypothetical protein